MPDGLRSHVVYKFARAGCNACYVGETARHFSAHVHEHLAVIGPLTSSNIYRILNIAMPWIASIF